MRTNAAHVIPIKSFAHANEIISSDADCGLAFEGLVGSSEPLRRVLAQVSKVAPTDATVLILGETGTGKELIARAIHNRSRRASRPFVRLNCGAIEPSLLTSELFGHEKGAFTGALQRRLGRFECANGGTIFLDEVGELPRDAQVALLRVLQEREFERLGGTQTISTDVRVLAATSRDLDSAIEDGAFRLDLFYRLNVFPVHVPPLRDRAGDVPFLARHFMRRFAASNEKRIETIDLRTLEHIQSYNWPGNIRELQNVVERAVILCEGSTLSIDEPRLQSPKPSNAALTEVLSRQQREMIEATLHESRGRIAGPCGAAKKLGMPRTTLESRIRALRIDKHKFKIDSTSRSKRTCATNP